MKKTLLVLLLFVQGAMASIQVQESSAQRYSFTWEMDGLVIDDTSGAAAAISFKNQNVELGDSAEALIPVFSFYIGIPPKGSVRASFNPQQTRSISLKHPLKTLIAKKKTKRYPNLHFSDQWISDGLSAIAGGITARQFILKPFLYDEKTNTILVLEKGSCVLEFSDPGQTRIQAAGAQSRPQTDYSRMVSRLILNYDIAAGWALPVSTLKKRKGSDAFPLTLSTTKPLIGFTIGDGHEDLNEGTIKENGIIKISGKDLQNLGSVIPIKQVAVYASYKGEMLTKTPDISALPEGVTEVPIIRFDVKSNGVIDPEDYILVYVTGSSDWAWNAEKQEYYYNLDRYEDYRHYWVTLKRTTGEGAVVQPMAKVADAGAAMSTTFQNHLLFKKSKEISHEGGDVERGEKSGLNWRWELLTSSTPSFSYQVTLPNIDANAPAQINLAYAYSPGVPVLTASFSNTPLCTLIESSVWYPLSYSGDHTLKLTGSNFRGSSDYIELASFEIKYEASLDLGANDGSMTVFSPETSSMVNYHVSNLPEEPVYIFRIEANENITLVDSLHPSKGSSYEWVDSAGRGIKYFICAKSAFYAAPSFVLHNPQTSDQLTLSNLRATENDADFLIISHPEFMDQALRLAKHKQNVHRFSRPKVVSVEDIYREFSGGNLDPAGIRNFLLYAHTQWSVKPDYVALMGKGHYNFKSIMTSEPIFIPTSENEDRCVEDFFAYLEPGADQDSLTAPVPSIFVGRLPCVTKEQAQQLVDKIIDMEDPSVADIGAWQNRVLLVNDDDKQVDNNKLIPDPLGFDHRNASDNVGAIISSQRPAVDIRKVNLFEYPLNTVLQKPEARDALINDINSGMSIVNFFGHGSPSLWTDERIFELNMVSNLYNEKHYPLIASFSCAVGEFDQPAPHRCLSEVLALALKSGAIATISGTREAYSENNRQLAKNLYQTLFDSTRSDVSLGEAYAEAKIIVRDQNCQIYSYLGDPSIRLVNPLHRIAFDVLDKSGRSIDTIKGLQAITIKGSIRTRDLATLDASYGSKDKPAFVQISIFNPPLVLVRENTGADTIPGTLIYTGQLSVTNGLFEQSLHIPRNVISNKPGAKVTAFSWQMQDNGFGFKPIIFDAITDTVGFVDTMGPTIALRPLYDADAASSIAAKSVIALSTGKIEATIPFRCEINVFDSSGIDVVGTGPDEGLTIEIKGVLSKQNINNKFRIDGGDYRKGNATIEFIEGMLKAGTYTLWTSAQDLAGNITRQSFTLEVSQSQDIAINHVFNYPNPVKMGKTTAFYYGLSKMTGITSTIKVYSMSGKLLRVFSNTHSGEVFDLRDQLGSPLGPNVYLYQLIVQDTYQQKTVKSGIQKLLIHPPR
jgi:hypothetical protein